MNHSAKSIRVFPFTRSDEFSSATEWWNIFHESLHPDEIEDRPTILKLMEHNVVSFNAAYIDDEMIGLSKTQALISTPCVFIGYLAVRKDMRSKGFGREILEQSYAQACEKLNSQGLRSLGMTIEADLVSPAQSVAIQEMNRKRMSFYESCGLRKLPIDYVQPALASGNPVPMNLLFRPEETDLRLDQSFGRKVANCLLKEKYCAFNGIPWSEIERLNP